MKTIDLAPQDIFLEKNDKENYSWPSVTENDFQNLKKLFSVVYDFFGAAESFDLVLTDSHEEALAQVFQSHYHKHIFLSGKSHIVTTDCISSSQRELISNQKKLGVEVSFIPKNEKGLLSVEALEKCITPKTSLVSIQWAHPITGIIQPLNDIISICQKHEIPLHVDVTGVLGKLDVSLESLQIDYLTFSIEEGGCDLYPAGVIAKPFMQLQALIPGYGIQKLKGGKFSVEKLQNLAKFLQALKESMYENLLEMPDLKKEFIRKFEATFPEGEILLKEMATLPSHIVFAFPYLHAEYLTYVLFQNDLRVCFGGNKYPTLMHLLNFSSFATHVKQGAVALNITHLNLEAVESIIALIANSLDPIKKTFKSLDRSQV